MLWLLDRLQPMTEENWLEFERQMATVHESLGSGRSLAEFEQAKADVVRRVVGNPFSEKSSAAHT